MSSRYLSLELQAVEWKREKLATLSVQQANLARKPLSKLI